MLILSENTGAHEELGEWALSVNPFDIDGPGQAIHAAIQMAPEERRARLEAIRDHVREHDVGRLDRGPTRRPRPLVCPRCPVVNDLSHVDAGAACGWSTWAARTLSRRRAVARATLTVEPETATRLRELPKGDAVAAAQIAGIMAAKRTSELIPLCHPFR